MNGDRLSVTTTPVFPIMRHRPGMSLAAILLLALGEGCRPHLRLARAAAQAQLGP